MDANSNGSGKLPPQTIRQRAMQSGFDAGQAKRGYGDIIAAGC
jgi:hypothetical protein